MTLKLLATLTAALIATAALADEKMTVPTPSSGCLSKVTAQLNLDLGTCVGSYPPNTQQYGACVTTAYLTYANAMHVCPVAPGSSSSRVIKAIGLRGLEANGTTVPKVLVR